MLGAGQTVKIGDYVFDPELSTLHNSQRSTKLEPLSHAFLSLLLEHHGQVVTKQLLLKHVWHDRYVTDDSVRRVVKKLRNAFSDDARQPKYIKTVSMQGYCLVADVQSVETENKQLDRQSLYKNPWMLMVGCVFAILASVILLSELKPESSKVQKTSRVAHSSVVQLTDQSGSEVNGDYNPTHDRLIYLHRANSNEVYHLYSKHLSSGEVKRLTFDDNTYHKVLWSPDGERVAYQKSGEVLETYWLAGFDPELGLVAPTQIENNQNFHSLLAWSQNGKALYFSGASNDSYSRPIFRLSLTDITTERMTFPNVLGYGDYAASESPDGKLLAVLRNVSERRYSLLILDLQSQDLVAQKPLNFFASSMVWHPDNSALALSSFKGDFYYYNLATDQLHEQKGSQPGLNDAFQYCGDGCYFMRKHHMNYTDIAEIPFPFEVINSQAYLYLASPEAEFNAIYNHDGNAIYYTRKDEFRGQLCKRTLNQACETLLDFNPRHILTHLALNPAETYLTGKLENRVFVIDLKTLDMQFVTSAIDHISVPTWKNNNDLLFSRQEQNTFVQMQYSLSRDKLSKSQDGVYMQKHLSDGRVFWADENGVVYERTREGVNRFVAQLPSVHYPHWTVHGDAFYYTHYQQRSVVLTRVSLVDGTSRTSLIAPNASSLNFSVHPTGSKMLVTKDLLADSDLVKVQWH